MYCWPATHIRSTIMLQFRQSLLVSHAMTPAPQRHPARAHCCSAAPFRAWRAAGVRPAQPIRHLALAWPAAQHSCMTRGLPLLGACCEGTLAEGWQGATSREPQGVPSCGVSCGRDSSNKHHSTFTQKGAATVVGHAQHEAGHGSGRLQGNLKCPLFPEFLWVLNQRVCLAQGTLVIQHSQHIPSVDHLRTTQQWAQLPGWPVGAC
jgi:hypothetical protein